MAKRLVENQTLMCQFCWSNNLEQYSRKNTTARSTKYTLKQNVLESKQAGHGGGVLIQIHCSLNFTPCAMINNLGIFKEVPGVLEHPLKFYF